MKKLKSPTILCYVVRFTMCSGSKQFVTALLDLTNRCTCHISSDIQTDCLHSLVLNLKLSFYSLQLDMQFYFFHSPTKRNFRHLFFCFFFLRVFFSQQKLCLAMPNIALLSFSLLCYVAACH